MCMVRLIMTIMIHEGICHTLVATVALYGTEEQYCIHRALVTLVRGTFTSACSPQTTRQTETLGSTLSV